MKHPNTEIGKYLESTLLEILGIITQDNEYAITKILSWVADF